MIDRLPAWLFMSLAMTLIGIALVPIMRFIVGIDATIGIQPLTVVMLFIGGLMCGLSGMILLVRRQPKISHGSVVTGNNKALLVKLHAAALLLFTGIPLANFLVCYWLWIRHRHKSEIIDSQGKEVLNFQITLYLYLLIAFFLALVIIGLFFIPILLLLHLVFTLFALFRVASGSAFQYPMNIPIIQGRPITNSA